MASRFLDKLALDPPPSRLYRLPSATEIVRYNELKYCKDESIILDGFRDSERVWKKQDRYAGVGLNCGYFFSCSDKASTAEMDFYNPGKPWRQENAKLTVRASHEGVLNLTEPDSIEFVFEKLLGIPYRRGSVRLAILASAKKGGNLFTDYIGAWAYHKGFQGVMFLGARALQPLRFKFDVSSRSDEESARYWAAMADEFDYFEMESVREEMRGRVTSFLNLAYFNGPFLMSKMESYRVDLPDGTSFAGENPHRGKSIEELGQLFGFENGAFLREQALAKMERLQDKVDLIAKITTDLIAKHNARILSNQDFGELLEKILVRADPFTFTTPPQDIS